LSIDVTRLITIVPKMSTTFLDSMLSALLPGQTRRAVLALLYGRPGQGAATPSFSHFIRADAKLERCGIAVDKEPAAGGG
jgi:hypothetical protein